MKCDDGDDKEMRNEEILLTENEVKSLNSIPVTQQKDATFIRILLEILYKNELSCLDFRSFSGSTRKKRQEEDSEPNTPFKAISPNKKKKIFELFKKRVQEANIPQEEKCIRLHFNNISKLVAVGIGNLRKTNRVALKSAVRAELE